MALVDHQRELRQLAAPGGKQLAEDQEELERLDRARRQVVVAVARVVEVEAAEPPRHGQPAHDLLDVRVREVVAQVDEAGAAWAGGLRQQQRAAPVGVDRGVEGRLVRLVLGEHAPVVRQVVVHRAQGARGALELRAVVGLARVAGAVGQPDRDGLRAELHAQVHDLQVVLDGGLAHRGVGAGEAAELVGQSSAAGGGRVVLEGVRVHRVEADAARGRVLLERGRVVRKVPRHVQRDRAVGGGERVEHGDVVDLLRGRAGLAPDGEAAEAGASGADGPGGRGHGEPSQRGHDLLRRRPGPRQACLEVVEIGGQLVAHPRVRSLDQLAQPRRVAVATRHPALLPKSARGSAARLIAGRRQPRRRRPAPAGPWCAPAPQRAGRTPRRPRRPARSRA